jgi:NitT/TauT family transport system ATP-binding protein
MKLTIDSIEKEFATDSGPMQALAQLSFDVGDGEFVSLLGPSGCGKSTTLYMIAGLEQSTGGAIYLDGQRVKGPGVDRGMVFQNYTLFPWLTVDANARFGFRLKANRPRTAAEAKAQDERVQSLLHLMGLEQFRNSYPRELSGGMKQRVAIARALAVKPKVLLMDEPFGALDAQKREEMQELLLMVSRHEKTTILFVTHDVEEALYLSTRVLVYSARPGRILKEIAVQFGEERNLEVKMNGEFMRLKREIFELLHQDGRHDRKALIQKIVNTNSN